MDLDIAIIKALTLLLWGNLLPTSSCWRSYVQVDAEVIWERNSVSYVGRLQGMQPIRTTKRGSYLCDAIFLATYCTCIISSRSVYWLAAFCWVCPCTSTFAPITSSFWKWTQHVPPKRRCKLTILHLVTTQKPVIWSSTQLQQAWRPVVCDFRLSLQCKWGLRSSGMFRAVDW
jgi:hypothetical protein